MHAYTQERQKRKGGGGSKTQNTGGTMTKSSSFETLSHRLRLRGYTVTPNCPSPASDDTIPLTKRDDSGRAALGGKNRSCARTDGTEPMQFAIPLS